MTPETFITELATMFGPPSTENPARYKRIVSDVLEPFGSAERERGCEAILANWTYRRWPTPAEIKRFCSQAGAELAKAGQGSAQPFVRNRHWRAAEQFTERWFDVRVDAALIDQAEQEGWTSELWQAVKSQAHSILVRGGDPQHARIGLDAERRRYYRDRATAYRLAAVYHDSPEYRARHGRRRMASRALGDLLGRSQSEFGEAILDHMERRRDAAE